MPDISTGGGDNEEGEGGLFMGLRLSEMRTEKTDRSGGRRTIPRSSCQAAVSRHYEAYMFGSCHRLLARLRQFDPAFRASHIKALVRPRRRCISPSTKMA